MKNARLDVEGAREGKKEAFTKYFPNVSAVGTAFPKANHGMMDMKRDTGASLELSMMDDGLLGGDRYPARVRRRTDRERQ